MTVMMNDSSFSIFAENRLEVLYAPIRYKMALALNNWHPSDSSAHKILEPWVKVSMGDLNTCGVMLATGNFGCLTVKHINFHGRFSLDKAWKCFWCVQFFQSWLTVFKWSFMSTHKGKKLVSRSA